MKYIHELSNWPNLSWDNKALVTQLASVRHQQGLLLGRMSTLGFDVKAEASLEVLTSDIIKSSEIEGVILDQHQVRSFLAKSLGVDIGGLSKSNRHIDGIVEMVLDATQRCSDPLTEKRLYSWHRVLFPRGTSGLHKIADGSWRSREAGPMQIVSGHIGRERVHFEAPAADRIRHEMKLFLDWFNKVKNIDPLLKAGVAHFWFVTIHPFEDGNGRIGRAIADMCLARADGIPERFYSMSSSIEKERKTYYATLESCQKGGLDITSWLKWFLACLSRAIENADKTLEKILYKSNIWRRLSSRPINERQRKVINLLLGEFQGKLTTSKYAKIAKCSQDTALRDMLELIDYGVMVKNPGSGRSTSYDLCFPI
ncbi:MAG: Fic family protein [Gammaproteobacteria bacterium]|nr:Fic family protein [Gammaproteobacteria bacterium]